MHWVKSEKKCKNSLQRETNSVLQRQLIFVSLNNTPKNQKRSTQISHSVNAVSRSKVIKHEFRSHCSTIKGVRSSLDTASTGEIAKTSSKGSNKNSATSAHAGTIYSSCQCLIKNTGSKWNQKTQVFLWTVSNPELLMIRYSQRLGSHYSLDSNRTLGLW